MDTRPYLHLIVTNGIIKWVVYARVGCRFKTYLVQNRKTKLFEHWKVCCLLLSLLYIPLHLSKISNDIETNPGPNNGFHKLKLCHINARSIKARNHFLHIECELANAYDVITVSETWLSSKDKSSNYKIPGYQEIFRRDRSDDEGYGGVMA